MPQECMKIEEIPQDEKLRGAKFRCPPNVGESSGMALACSRKLLWSASEVRECGWTIRVTRMLRGNGGRKD
jgi:hypothetical protein